MINIPKSLCKPIIIESVITKKTVPIPEKCNTNYCIPPKVSIHSIEKSLCPCPVKAIPLIHQTEKQVTRVIKTCFSPGAFEEYILAITSTKTCNTNPVCKTPKP